MLTHLQEPVEADETPSDTPIEQTIEEPSKDKVLPEPEVQPKEKVNHA
jgi:hypothetical protein